MAMGAGGLLSGLGSAVTGLAETGVDAVKFTIEQGGKVVKAVRDDRTEIEIPGWMLGNKKGEPVKIPSQLFGYMALGLGVYVLARILGVRPFDWLTEQMGAAGSMLGTLTQTGQGTGVDGKVTTPEERAQIAQGQASAAAAEANETPESKTYYMALKIKGQMTFYLDSPGSLEKLQAVMNAYKAAHAEGGWYIAKADLGDDPRTTVRQKGLEGWTQYF